MEKNKNKSININQAINFIEELSWLIERKKGVSLTALTEFLREKNNLMNSSIKVSSKGNSNKHILVGILPELLQNNEIFSNRDDLLDFAEQVFNIKISRKGKRSRTEYIGLIICEISKLNDFQLKEFVNSLSEISGSEIKLAAMKEEKKKPNFSWNETIIKLSGL